MFLCQIHKQSVGLCVSYFKQLVGLWVNHFKPISGVVRKLFQEFKCDLMQYQILFLKSSLDVLIKFSQRRN